MEIRRLTEEKLKLDVANGKRINDTYWVNFALTLIALLISVFLAALKLAGK